MIEVLFQNWWCQFNLLCSRNHANELFTVNRDRWVIESRPNWKSNHLEWQEIMQNWILIISSEIRHSYMVIPNVMYLFWSISWSISKRFTMYHVQSPLHFRQNTWRSSFSIRINAILILFQSMDTCQCSMCLLLKRIKIWPGLSSWPISCISFQNHRSVLTQILIEEFPLAEFFHCYFLDLIFI